MRAQGWFLQTRREQQRRQLLLPAVPALPSAPPASLHCPSFPEVARSSGLSPLVPLMVCGQLWQDRDRPGEWRAPGRCPAGGPAPAAPGPAGCLCPQPQREPLPLHAAQRWH